jgi:hypothetical protein
MKRTRKTFMLPLEVEVDVVKRLRSGRYPYRVEGMSWFLEAADEIERLGALVEEREGIISALVDRVVLRVAEIERLRGLLRDAEQCIKWWSECEGFLPDKELMSEIDAALTAKTRRGESSTHSPSD